MDFIPYRNGFQKAKSLLKKQPYLFLHGLKGTGKEAFICKYFPDYRLIDLRHKADRTLFEQDPFRFFLRHDQKTLFLSVNSVADFFTRFEAYSPAMQHHGRALMVSDCADTNARYSLPILPLSQTEWKQEHRFSHDPLAAILQGGFPEADARHYRLVLEQIFREAGSDLRKADVTTFKKLLDQLVLQTDQPLNVSVIARDLNITAPTATKWIRLLQDWGLILFLDSWPHAMGKRRITAPKLYMSDTGLACYLLGIRNTSQLIRHDAFNALFRNLVFLELYKKNVLDPFPKRLFYWRESNGHEIHFIRENAGLSIDIFHATPVQHAVANLADPLKYFDELTQGRVLSAAMIYGGMRAVQLKDIHWLAWHQPS